jgi:hypothetical protein
VLATSIPFRQKPIRFSGWEDHTVPIDGNPSGTDQEPPLQGGKATSRDAPAGHVWFQCAVLAGLRTASNRNRVRSCVESRQAGLPWPGASRLS